LLTAQAAKKQQKINIRNFNLEIYL